MTALRLPEDAGGNRFPGFDSVAQSPHWDESTRAVVLSRLEAPAPLRFFTLVEARTAGALFDQLLDQRDEPRVPVLQIVDERLAVDHTDGWRYHTMPKEPDAWRRTLAALDADAVARHDREFGRLEWSQQHDLLQAVQDLGQELWHGMPAAQVWSLWTRYACTAFYSHPFAWDEIGFSGPAYPRGYKNIGVDRREPFEVADQRPAGDGGAGS